MQLDHGLLTAIIENPDDDLPRLLAADWHEERGDNNAAQLIRSQLANPTAIRIGWMTHSGQTKLEYFPEGSHDVEPLLDSLGCGPTFIQRRGFIESITTCWFHWSSNHVDLCTSYPVRQVRLKSWAFIGGDDGYDRPDAVVFDFLKTLWPGIKFINTGRDC